MLVNLSARSGAYARRPLGKSRTTDECRGRADSTEAFVEGAASAVAGCRCGSLAVRNPRRTGIESRRGWSDARSCRARTLRKSCSSPVEVGRGSAVVEFRSRSCWHHCQARPGRPRSACVGRGSVARRSGRRGSTVGRSFSRAQSVRHAVCGIARDGLRLGASGGRSRADCRPAHRLYTGATPLPLVSAERPRCDPAVASVRPASIGRSHSHP